VLEDDTTTKEADVPAEIDRGLIDKAADVTASALRGAMGGQGSQPPSYAAEVFREIFGAMKEAIQELPERGKTGF
jgi:hypothetical protein